MASAQIHGPRMNGEEGIGLLAAVVLHVGLLAVLLLRPTETPIPPPERIEVTLSDDAALTSTSPDPQAQPAPLEAPELGEAAPAVPETLPEPAPPEPVASPSPPPVPKPTAKPVPKPVPKPVAKPVPKPTPKPVAKPSPQPAPKPTVKPAAKPAAKPSPKPSAKPATVGSSTAATKPVAKPGGSKVGSNFLDGVSGAKPAGSSNLVPASAIGADVKSSLVGQLSRELKPHWAAPQGPDVEKIVTILSFSLNADGTLAGKPTVENQLGVNDTNRAQSYRHAEQAIRAVQLAAPFDLPPQYYNAWKRVKSFRFDRRLSQ
jgi:outer membrane biosynthesis protein TonB